MQHSSNTAGHMGVLLSIHHGGHFTGPREYNSPWHVPQLQELCLCLLTAVGPAPRTCWLTKCQTPCGQLVSHQSCIPQSMSTLPGHVEPGKVLSRLGGSIPEPNEAPALSVTSLWGWACIRRPHLVQDVEHTQLLFFLRFPSETGWAIAGN